MLSPLAVVVGGEAVLKDRQDIWILPKGRGFYSKMRCDSG